jgi:hypothetical protein
MDHEHIFHELLIMAILPDGHRRYPMQYYCSTCQAQFIIYDHSIHRWASFIDLKYNIQLPLHNASEHVDACWNQNKSIDSAPCQSRNEIFSPNSMIMNFSMMLPSQKRKDLWQQARWMIWMVWWKKLIFTKIQKKRQNKTWSKVNPDHACHQFMIWINNFNNLSDPDRCRFTLFESLIHDLINLPSLRLSHGILLEYCWSIQRENTYR